MPFKKTAAHAPVLVSAPRIVSAVPGTYQVGILLTCIPGTYANNPTVRTYQWKLDGVSIGGATATTYLPTDPGAVTCVETVSNTKGSLATSTLSVAVQAAILAPVALANPAITGSTVQNGTATLSTGTWSNSPTGYAAQWYRGAAPIAGATNFTYGLQAADVGQNITGNVTATNAGGPATATSNVVVPTAAPSGIPIANAAALTAMFAAGVGASGGKTYLLAAIDFGNVALRNYDFSSNPVIISGQAGTLFTSLILSNVKGVSLATFNVYGASSGGYGIEVTSGSAHIALDGVTSNSQTSWGTQSGNGMRVRDASFVTINGRRDASLSDITGRNNGLTLLDATDITVTNLTITNNRIDGIRPVGCARVLIDGCLGYGWFPQINDHSDFIQWFDSANNPNLDITITNNGWLRTQGGGADNGAAQGYFGEQGTNFIIGGNYAVGTLLNSISRSKGAETQIDDNFVQGYPDYGSRIIVRAGSVNCSVTNNSAGSISNYAGNGVNPGFVPAVLPGSNTIIANTTPGNFFYLDAWLATHPLARARP